MLNASFFPILGPRRLGVSKFWCNWILTKESFLHILGSQKRALSQINVTSMIFTSFAQGFEIPECLKHPRGYFNSCFFLTIQWENEIWCFCTIPAVSRIVPRKSPPLWQEFSSQNQGWVGFPIWSRFTTPSFECEAQTRLDKPKLNLRRKPI